MKKYLKTIENLGIGLLIAAFVITGIWGSNHAFFPMLFAVVLLVIVAAYKALHWDEYLSDNKRNLVIFGLVVVFGLMMAIFGL